MANELIRVVAGNNRPIVQLILRDEFTDDPVDISQSTTSIVVLFRAIGEVGVLATLPCTKTGATGGIKFSFPGASLAVQPGLYEGDVVIDYNGEKQTAYEKLRFRVRAA